MKNALPPSFIDDVLPDAQQAEQRQILAGSLIFLPVVYCANRCGAKRVVYPDERQGDDLQWERVVQFLRRGGWHVMCAGWFCPACSAAALARSSDIGEKRLPSENS